MTKYLITIASEIDGHAGGSAYYIQTEDRITRAEKIRIIDAIFGKDSKFMEGTYAIKNEGDMNFHGEVQTSFIHDGETITYSESVAINMIKLPSRMEKNKLYGVETQTG